VRNFSIVAWSISLSSCWSRQQTIVGDDASITFEACSVSNWSEMSVAIPLVRGVQIAIEIPAQSAQESVVRIRSCGVQSYGLVIDAVLAAIFLRLRTTARFPCAGDENRSIAGLSKQRFWSRSTQRSTMTPGTNTTVSQASA